MKIRKYRIEGGPAYMIELTDEEFGAAVEAMGDPGAKRCQEWESRRELHKLISCLLLVGMGAQSAKEVLACCSISASE